MVESVSDIIHRISPYYKKKGESESKHELGYDSSTETLEPVYFFILDLMNNFGLKTEKLVDSFTSAPGSSHFSELNQRAGILQQQAQKTLGDINTVLRSVMNIIYDLKDFKIRLEHYDHLKSKDPSTKDAAVLALKQIWMDKVDMQKGKSSLKAMAMSQAGFVTLIDAFLAAKDVKAVDKLDLNERVKRILRPRIMEFNQWLIESERELRKRYQLERNYLASQVNSLRLYSRWAKPYLKAAADLEQKEQGRNPDLIKTFNSILLELTLLGKQKIDVKSKALEGDLPQQYSREKFLKTLKRDYYVCIVLDFYFRGIPQRVSQQGGFAFGGKTTVTYKAYVLNEDELKKLDQELNKSDIGNVLSLVEGITEDSLKELQEDIDDFLKEKEQEEKAEKKPKDTSNPFLALFGKYEGKPKKSPKKEEEKEIVIKPDNFFEKELLRKLGADEAKSTSFAMFDVYKKGHGMASYT